MPIWYVLCTTAALAESSQGVAQQEKPNLNISNTILDINMTSTLGMTDPIQLNKINLKHNSVSLIYSTGNDHLLCVSFKTKVKHLC